MTRMQMMKDDKAAMTRTDRKNGLLARFIARILENAGSDSADYTVDGLLPCGADAFSVMPHEMDMELALC